MNSYSYGSTFDTDCSYSYQAFDKVISGPFLEYIIIIFIIGLIIYILYKLYVQSKEKIKTDLELSQDFPKYKNKPISTILKKASKEYPDEPALMVKKDNNVWSCINYKEYWSNSLDFAKEQSYWIGSHILCGVIGFNSPAWYYTIMGTFINNSVCASIDPTISKSGLVQILNENKINMIVVEDDTQLEKLVGEELPNIQLILYYSPVSFDTISKFTIPVISFGAFMDSKEKAGIQINTNPSLDDQAIKIFDWAGKSTNITHGNIISYLDGFIGSTSSEFLINITRGERFISYLPLHHLTGQLIDIYLPIYTCSVVWFGFSNAQGYMSKNNLSSILSTVKPTIFFGLNEAWENIKKLIEKKTHNDFILDKLPTLIVKNKILNSLGLSQCKLCLEAYGNIWVNNKTINYLESFGLKLYRTYNYKQNLGIVSIGPCSSYESIGTPIQTIELKISNGDILVKGPCIPRNMPTDKWIDASDKVETMGELINLSVGESLSPYSLDKLNGLLESNIQKLDIGIAYGIIVGIDNKLYAIIVPNDGVKQEQLDEYTTKLIELIQEFNTQIIYPHTTLSGFSWLNTQFTPGKELTPGLKYRRSYILTKYKDKLNLIKF